MSELWTFWFTQALLCVRSSFVAQVSFPFMCDTLSFQIKFLNSIWKIAHIASICMFEHKNLLHILDFSISFDSHVWT